MAKRPRAGLIGNEDAFVAAYVRCCDPQQAAIAAGYAHGESGYGLLRRPQVVEAIAKQRSAMLRGELVPMALGALRDVLKTGTPRERVAAAEGVRKWAADTDGAGNGERKAISEMTSEELDAEIDRIRRLQSERATPILELAPIPIEGPRDPEESDPFA